MTVSPTATRQVPAGPKIGTSVYSAPSFRRSSWMLEHRRLFGTTAKAGVLSSTSVRSEKTRDLL